MSAQPHGPHRTPAEIRASIRDDRSPRAIRAALPPEDRALFEQEYGEALEAAKKTYDLSPVYRLVDAWWGLAVLKADPDEYERIRSTAELAAAYLEHGQLPPGSVVADEKDKARLRERIEQGA